jgi:hypothetical protein
LSTYAKTESLPKSKSELSWADSFPLEDRIIAEVAWVGSDALLVKETDRAARRGNVIVFEGSDKGKVVRTLGAQGEEGDNGWIDAVSFSLTLEMMLLIKSRVRTSDRYMLGYQDISTSYLRTDITGSPFSARSTLLSLSGWQMGQRVKSPRSQG